MFSSQTDHIANAAKMLTASAAFAAGPGVKTATSVYDAARKLFKTPPPGLHSMSIEVTALANEAFEGFRHDLPDDADIRFEQMIAATLPDAETITKAGMQPDKVAQAMRAQLSDPDHLAPPMPQLLEDIVTPVFTRLFADTSFAAELTPALWEQILKDLSRIGGTVEDNNAMLRKLVGAMERDEVAALTRDQLELLASRFEIESPHTLSDAQLRQLLTQKAEEYRSYRAQIDALDDRIAGVHNLKAAAQDAAERLDFDEVEELLSRVDRVETEIMAETRDARANNALLRGRVDQAYEIMDSVACSFREIDVSQMCLRRLAYFHVLRDFGLRHGGNATLRALQIVGPAVEAIEESGNKADKAKINHDIAGAKLQLATQTPGPEGVLLMKEAEEAYRKVLGETSQVHQPYEWATAAQNLANVLKERGMRTDGTSGGLLLKEAIQVYQNALTVRTKEKFPVEWATTLQNLALAFHMLGLRIEGTGSTTLIQAAAKLYRSALTVRTAISSPRDWGTTSHNLGSALRDLGFRTEGSVGVTLLIEAARAFRDALSVRTRADDPIGYSNSTDFLALTLLNAGARTKGVSGTDLIAESVATYRELLETYTRSNDLLDWAETKRDLAAALKEQGIRTGGRAGISLLSEAVGTGWEALEVFKAQSYPVECAFTHEDLAHAEKSLAEHPATDAPKPHLVSALTHVDDALTIFDPDHMSHNHAKASRLREAILAALDALP